LPVIIKKSRPSRLVGSCPVAGGKSAQVRPGSRRRRLEERGSRRRSGQTRQVHESHQGKLSPPNYHHYMMQNDAFQLDYLSLEDVKARRAERILKGAQHFIEQGLINV